MDSQPGRVDSRWRASLERHPFAGAFAFVLLLTVFLTWPQALHLGTRVAAHSDSYFSMWRLAWIAHALGTDPSHLYDANILYPARNTLAYSDAVALEGALGAPLLWAGLPLVLVYNLLLLGGIATSGLGMFVLVHHLTRKFGAALVSAAVFTLLPYRVEHIFHIELQWTMWMPLAFWAVHRAMEDGSWRFGVLAGVFVWFQVLSSVYYGLFLAAVLPLLAIMLAPATSRRSATVGLSALALGAIVAAALVFPYARPYIENAGHLGPRDVSAFSAWPANYITFPQQNWLWGWTGTRLFGNELHLAPGFVAMALALFALARRPGRLTWVYVVLCALAVELSFGLNGLLYPFLYSHVSVLADFRAIARIAIVAFCALAVLAGLGTEWLQQRLSSRPEGKWVCAAACLLLVIESGSAPIAIEDVPTGTPSVYRILNQLPPGVVIELPVPAVDPLYQYWSKEHWKPMVNGYSGYLSSEYIDALDWMKTFPDDQSIERLKDLDVRYVIVHRGFYSRAAYTALMLEVVNQPQLKPGGTYRDWVDDTSIFELR